MELDVHSVIQMQYGGDDVAIFLFEDGRKPRIFSIGFFAEFASFKELMQEWHEYDTFAVMHREWWDSGGVGAR